MKQATAEALLALYTGRMLRSFHAWRRNPISMNLWRLESDRQCIKIVRQHFLD